MTNPELSSCYCQCYCRRLYIEKCYPSLPCFVLIDHTIILKCLRQGKKMRNNKQPSIRHECKTGQICKVIYEINIKSNFIYLGESKKIKQRHHCRIMISYIHISIIFLCVLYFVRFRGLYAYNFLR